MSKKKPKQRGFSSRSQNNFHLKLVRLDIWRKRLSTLLKYAKKASTTTNLDELLQLLVEESKSVLNAERATVFLVDR
jgi:hypothetical protein